MSERDDDGLNEFRERARVYRAVARAIDARVATSDPGYGTDKALRAMVERSHALEGAARHLDRAVLLASEAQRLAKVAAAELEVTCG